MKNYPNYAMKNGLMLIFALFSFCNINGQDSVIGPQWTEEKSFSNWLEEKWLPLKHQLEAQELETIILAFKVTEQGQIANMSLSMKSWKLAKEMTNLITSMPAWISASWNGENIATIVYSHILIGSKVPESTYSVDPATHIFLWNRDYIKAHKVYTSDFSWSGNYNVRLISDPPSLKVNFNADITHYVSRAPLYDSMTLDCLKKYGKNILANLKKKEGVKNIQSGVFQFWVNTKGEIHDVLLRYSEKEYFSIPADVYSVYSPAACSLQLMKIQGNSSPTVWTLPF